VVGIRVSVVGVIICEHAVDVALAVVLISVAVAKSQCYCACGRHCFFGRHPIMKLVKVGQLVRLGQGRQGKVGPTTSRVVVAHATGGGGTPVGATLAFGKDIVGCSGRGEDTLVTCPRWLMLACLDIS
jgi:hypothetical protein